MPFSLNDVVLGGVLPAIVAAVLSWMLRRWRTSDAGRNLATVVPFLAGFHVGYWSLSLGKVNPQSHWEWLPWVMLFTVRSCVPWFAGSDSTRHRVMLTMWIAAIASWLLVPTWNQLEPSRLVHWIVLATSVVLVATFLEPLASKFPAVEFLSLLAFVLTATAIVLALSGSLRFAQMSGCGVAALAGVGLASVLGKSPNHAAGIGLPFAMLSSGLMLIGQVNSFSDVPLVSYVLPPLAPLSLWFAVRGPLAKLKGYGHWLGLTLPVVMCAAAVVAAVAESGADF